MCMCMWARRRRLVIVSPCQQINHIIYNYEKALSICQNTSFCWLRWQPVQTRVNWLRSLIEPECCVSVCVLRQYDRHTHTHSLQCEILIYIIGSLMYLIWFYPVSVVLFFHHSGSMLASCCLRYNKHITRCRWLQLTATDVYLRIRQ